MMGWYDGGVGWGGWMVMSLTMLLFWGLVVFAVVAIFRGTSREGTSRDGGDRSPAERRPDALPDPRAILDQRFAKGEIDLEEYTARREALDATRTTQP